MKRILFCAVILFSLACKAQFPTTDSLHRYNNRYIRGSAVDAFSQLRLNTLLHGIIQFIDTARAGGGGALGVDTLYALNDSTIRYRKNGVTLDFPTKGIYSLRRKVDTAFAFNDTTIRFLINGDPTDVKIKGNNVRKLSDSTLIVYGDTMLISGAQDEIDPLSLKRDEKLFSRSPVVNTLPQFRSIPSGELDENFVYKYDNSDWKFDPSDPGNLDDSVMYIHNMTGDVLVRQFEDRIYLDWWILPGETDASDAYNRMLSWVARAPRSYIISHKKREYLINDTVFMPNQLVGTSQQIRLKIDGNGVIYNKTTTGPLFYRMPTDQNASIAAYSLTIEGLKIQGDFVPGSVGIKIGALYTPIIKECLFFNLDTAIVAPFWLNGIIKDNFFTTNVSVAFKGCSGEGYWADATLSNSAFNVNRFEGNRIFNGNGSFAGLMLLADDDTKVRDHTSEGFNPRFDIYQNFGGSTAVNGSVFEQLYFESIGGTNGSKNICMFLRTNGHTSIRGIQNDYSDTLFKVAEPGDGASFDVSGIKFYPFVGKIFDWGGIHQSDVSLDLSAMRFSIADKFLDTTYYVGGVIGPNISGVYYDGFKTTYLPIRLHPGANNSPFNKNLFIDANILWETDDCEHCVIGGRYNLAYNRPRAGWFGTGGVFVDSVYGGIGWGTTNGNWVGFRRDSIGQIGVMDWNYNYLNLKAKRGLFTQRTGYTIPLTIEDLNPWDFPTRDMLEKEIGKISLVPNLNFGFGLYAPNYQIGGAIEVDTNVISTNYHTQYLIDSLAGTAIGGGMSSVIHDSTLTGDGNTPDSLRVNLQVVAGRSEVYNSIDSLGAAVITPDGSETKLISDAGYTISGSGTIADPYKLVLTGSPSSNPLNAISLTSYGFIADANVGAGNYATGTNNTPALQNAINAAADNQIIIVPSGGLFSTPLDTIRGTKTIQVWFLNKHYQAGNELFIIKHSSGAFKQHFIWQMGEMTDRINIPTHSKATHDAGTQPNWSAFTGKFVTIVNTSQVKVEINRMVGFKAGVEIKSGYGDGSQENSIHWRVARLCALGVFQTSIDGNSYDDKNKWSFDRFSGGLAIKIDGYAPAAAVNGENYNGAHRSIEVHGLIEQVDSIADCYADMTEPLFDVVVEGGTNTGVFGTGWRMRSTSPNFVRAPRYAGRGYFEWKWINGTGNNGMGINGWIDKPIWNGGVQLATNAIINKSGYIGCYAPSDLSLTNRNNAGGNFYFVSVAQKQIDTTITSSTYTVGIDVRWIRYNNSSGTLTFPAANVNVDREVAVANIHGSGSLAVVNTNYSPISSGEIMHYKSDGSTWRAMINSSGGGGGGSTDSFWTKAANNIDIYRSSRIGIKKTTPTANLHIAGSDPATANTAPIKIDEGLLNTPENGAIERDANNFTVTTQNVRKILLTVPESGGTPGDLISVGPSSNFIYAKSRYTLASTQIGFQTFTSATRTTMFVGGAKTFSNAGLLAGDMIEIEGGGKISTTSGSQPITFYLTSGGTDYDITTGVSISGSLTTQSFTYKIKIVPQATGTSVSAFVVAEFTLPGGTTTREIFGTTGFNCTSPVIDLLGDWNNSGNTITTWINDIEIKRK